MEDLEKTLKEIKRDFYSHRNGIVADALRKLYPPNTVIFGLNVPQFIEIASKYPKDLDLGLSLWREKNLRESRLLALYLLPVAEISPEIAKELFRDVHSTEEAEFLAFRILRNLPFAKDLFLDLSGDTDLTDLQSFTLSMFKRNLDSLSL